MNNLTHKIINKIERENGVIFTPFSNGKTMKLLKREKMFLRVSKLEDLSLISLAQAIQNVAVLSEKLDDELEKRDNETQKSETENDE